jgi:hypothetical protein
MRDIAASLHAVDLSALLSRSATASWSLCTTCCVTVGRMKIWEATPSISTIGSSFRSSWSGGSNAWGITSNFSRSLRLDTLSGLTFSEEKESERILNACLGQISYPHSAVSARRIIDFLLNPPQECSDQPMIRLQTQHESE